MKLALKTALMTAFVVLTNVLGNFCLSFGMKRAGPLSSPLVYIQTLFNPPVAIGISLLIVWVLSRMTLLSWADLSYVLPVTSVGYAIAALMGRFLLAETVSPQRWMGTLLIVGGTALVGATAPRTTGHGGGA